ncbi:MAG: hydroxyacid dehydrogenase [Fidelibacterota bacterium]|nr:MAG: hydroxyacid dehydrogenase [Candidatus Neomarinimicrobiota bacterium]
MTSRHKVLLFEPIHPKGLTILEEKCNVVFPESTDENELIRQVGDVEGIIIRASGKVSRQLIESAPLLKVVGRHGIGLDNIDLAAARERGISVVHTPTAVTQSVAEHFVGLAIMLAKKLKAADNALREGIWEARHALTGSELSGKTLSVLGFGRIGKQTARICRRCFDMSILYHDIVNYPEAEEELGAKQVPLEQLFTEGDLISVNLPLTHQTRGLIDADLLRLMKPTAYLINMARGALWIEADIVRALKEQRIAGVGSDVFEKEPPSTDNPLFELENFIGTPHMASHTEEALIRMSLVARDIVRILEGQPPEFPVPDYLYDQA